MPLFEDEKLSKSRRMVLSLCHFFLGAFLGLVPALIVFSITTMMNPDPDVVKIVGLLLLIFCLPPGLLFVILGFFGNGKIIIGIFRLLGRHTG